jgi:hypothetical protein
MAYSFGDNDGSPRRGVNYFFVHKLNVPSAFEDVENQITLMCMLLLRAANHQ